LTNERPFHACFGMPRHGAEEGVGAGGEVGADRGLAFGDQLGDGDLLAVLLDRDVVFERGRVIEVDRDLAGLAGQAGLVEGDRRGVGGQLKGAARTRGFGFACVRGAFFRGFLDRFGFGAGRGVVALGFELLAGLLELGCLRLFLVLGMEDGEGGGAATRIANQRITSGKALPGKSFTFRPIRLISTAETARAIRRRRRGFRCSQREDPTH